MVELNLKLPDGFIDEEVRCDYTVSSKIKEVWAVELDLLAEFQRVANKYNIKYMANGGTMLGAVRHKGFIPWDDDIDIMLMRDEYDRLCEIAEKEFNYPYFFQTERSDPGSFRCHAQLRNCKTTALLIDEQLGSFNYNQGIFIDIFPLDAVSDNIIEWDRTQKSAMACFKWMWNCAHLSCQFIDNPSIGHYKTKRILHRFFNPLFLFLAHYFFRRYERYCKMYNNQKTALVSLYSWGFDRKRFRSRVDHEETIMMDFEFLKMPVCKNYDKVLTETFGNWRLFVKGGSVHSSVLFDTCMSYREYNKMRHANNV